MNQQLSDPPETKAEAERRKSAPPPIALFIALGLVGAFLLFFVPAYVFDWQW